MEEEPAARRIHVRHEAERPLPVPLGSIAATTFWLRRRDSACEIGARSSDPSLASPRAAPTASNIRANLRERATSAGARASARMIENGAAKVA